MAELFGQRIEPEFDIRKEERDNRLNRALWVGVILLFAYGIFRTLTVEVFQAYIATIVSYGMVFYVKWGAHLRKVP